MKYHCTVIKEWVIDVESETEEYAKNIAYLESDELDCDSITITAQPLQPEAGGAQRLDQPDHE